MKKKLSRFLALSTTALVLLSSSCQFLGIDSHKHDFTHKVIDEKYLKSEATCEKAAFYYYSCECGEAGQKAFPDGMALPHDYSAEIASEQYLKKAATCQKGAEYFKSCVMCGEKTYQTFHSDELGEHAYTQEKPDAVYLKEEATFTSSAVYYKSCVCGLKGSDFFSYGEPLREYTDEEKVAFTPTSLTVTLYDTQTNTYGFTYNTMQQPLRPVIQVAEGDSLTDYTEYNATTMEAQSYKTNGERFTYYIVKAEVALEKEKTYFYRAYDKYVETGSEVATLQTKDTSSTTFSFAHLSDSQNSNAMGTYFGRVLSNIVNKNDFIVHTGDVVETSQYESEWTSMLHDNFEYVSKIPMMALSGNHETTYKNGYNETFKHFNHQIPNQDTGLGYYYSFTYGNAKFIMLNTNRASGSRLEQDQYDWLISELENNTATWTFVALHNPLYSAGTYGSDPSRNSIALALRSQLKDVFAEYGVDVVLQGHDHLVSRTHPIDKNGDTTNESWQTINGVQYSIDPNGVIYVMDGPAGTQTRSPNENMEPTLYKYAQESQPCSWAEFAIDGNMLTVTVQYTNGTQITEYQKWGIKKSA